MPFLTAIIAGLLIGVVVGALGAGGGILSVPVLTYVLGQSPHDAAAGSLVIVALTALVSLRAPAKEGRVRWREGAVFGALSVVGAAIGGRVSVGLDGLLLMRLFCAMLLATGIVMLVKGLRAMRASDSPETEAHRRGLPAIIAAATFTGFLTGFFGVGGGFIVVPMLVLALGFSMKEASGTSLLVMIFASAAGLISRVGTSVSVDWSIVLIFAVASMCGGLLGAPITRRVSSNALTISFGILLLAVATASFIPTL